MEFSGQHPQGTDDPSESKLTPKSVKFNDKHTPSSKSSKKIGSDQKQGTEEKKSQEKIRENRPQKAKASTKTGKKKTAEKLPKIPKEPKENSKELSVNLFLEGKSPTEIAAEREMALSTIMGHLGYGVKTGKLKLEQLVAEKEIQEIQAVAGKFDSLKPYYEFFEGKYDYGTLRLVLFSEER
jgi:uncharacterized protein YpbB